MCVYMCVWERMVESQEGIMVAGKDKKKERGDGERTKINEHDVNVMEGGRERRNEKMQR